MTEICAKLLSLKYHSSISIATFESDSERLVIYGDRRMTSILSEYVDDEVILNVENEYTWKWRRGAWDLPIEG